MLIRVFIQARQSSMKFPGKVLAPLHGIPIIKRVITQVSKVIHQSFVTVLTSTMESDDPIFYYVRALGVSCFRGSLDDVFVRFRAALVAYPCDYFFRISADSPLMDTEILQRMVQSAYTTGGEADIITNVFPQRTFPKGQSAELIRMRTFLSVDPAVLTPYEREHVAPYFYNHHQQFHIVSVESGDPSLAEQSFAVDTVDDLKRLEGRNNTEAHSSALPPLGTD